MEENENKQPLNFNISMKNEAPNNLPSQQNSQTYQNNLHSQESIDFTNFLSHATNPGIVLFTLLFKTLAIVAFLVLGIFGFSVA